MNKYVVEGGVSWIWIPDLTLDNLHNLSKYVS